RTSARAYVAILTSGATEFRLRLGQIGRASDGQPAIWILRRNAVADVRFDHIERHRRLKMPVRQLRQALGCAGHTHEVLDMVVPGSDVAIADGPVGPMTV